MRGFCQTCASLVSNHHVGQSETPEGGYSARCTLFIHSADVTFCERPSSGASDSTPLHLFLTFHASPRLHPLLSRCLRPVHAFFNASYSSFVQLYIFFLLNRFAIQSSSPRLLGPGRSNRGAMNSTPPTMQVRKGLKRTWHTVRGWYSCTNGFSTQRGSTPGVRMDPD